MLPLPYPYWKKIQVNLVLVNNDGLRQFSPQQQLPPLDRTPRSTAHLIGMELYRRELSAIEMVRVLNNRTRSAM
jgi:hypothetical protein